MSVILQIRVNGGAPQTGGVTAVSGNTIQFTAADKSTWSTDTEWRIYSIPDGFSLPAGWSSDANGYFFLGNADPPSFTVGSWWGKLGVSLRAKVAGQFVTDTSTALVVESPNGLRGLFRGEGAQFGGSRERWVGELMHDLKVIDAELSGGGGGTAAATPSTNVARDGAAGSAFVQVRAESLARTTSGDLTVSTTAGHVRIQPSTTFCYLPTYVICGDGGGFAQISSPRLTISNTTAGKGIWCDDEHFTQELHLGYSQELRLGDGVARPLLGLNGRQATDVPEVDDIGQLMRALTRVGIITSTETGYTIALVGDSLWSVGATIPAEGACRKIEANITGARIVNLTRPGDGATSPAHAYRRAPVGGKAIAVLTYGINNFLGGQSDATLRTNYAAEVTALLAAGYDEVIACTVVPAGTTVLSAGQNTQRLSFNTWLLANFASIGCVSVIDVATAPNLTDPTNATYFLADQLHFTNAGHTAYAAAFTTGINARLTGAALPTQNIGASGAETNYNRAASLIQHGSSLVIDRHQIRYRRTFAGFFDMGTNHTPEPATTTNATPTVLWTWPITAGRGVRVMVDAIAADDANNEIKSFSYRYASAMHVGGTLSQVGSTTFDPAHDHSVAGMSAAALTIQFNATDGQVVGTGIAGRTLRWGLDIYLREVALA